MFHLIATLITVGVLTGGPARLFVPGPDPRGLIDAWLLGIVGSFPGYVLFDDDHAHGVFQSAHATTTNAT